MSFRGWKPYVPVAKRREQAARKLAKLQKKGQTVAPVVARRTIAASFWGKSWCDNLERYSDFANRLPRGRTYVRNGSVVDLQIAKGEVTAKVAGSELYSISISIAPVAARLARWASRPCAAETGRRCRPRTFARRVPIVSSCSDIECGGRLPWRGPAPVTACWREWR